MSARTTHTVRIGLKGDFVRAWARLVGVPAPHASDVWVAAYAKAAHRRFDTNLCTAFAGAFVLLLLSPHKPFVSNPSAPLPQVCSRPARPTVV